MDLHATALQAAAAALATVLDAEPELLDATLSASFRPGSTSHRVTGTDSTGARTWPDTDLPEEFELLDALGAATAEPAWTLELTTRRDRTWQATAVPGDPGEVVLRPIHFPQQPALLPELSPERRAELQELWTAGAHDYGGNHLAVDTVPGPTGVPGQIIEFGRDLDGGFLQADSLVDFFAGRRNTWPEDPHIDHVVHAETPRPLTEADVPADIQCLRVFGFRTVSGEVAAHAAALKLLIIRNADTVDLAGLDGVELQELRLLDIPEVDLAPLADHPTLRIVNLESIGELHGVEKLGTLPVLETVSFADTPADAALEVLAQHPTLHRVEFKGRQSLAEKAALGKRLGAGTTAAMFSGTV